MPTQKRRKGKIAACQCDPNCPHKALPNSAFCSIHSRSCHLPPLLTGYEPAPQYEIYNGNKAIHDSHNCLAYAVGALFKNSTSNDPFPQPGVFSGHKDFRKTRRKTCPDMVARMLGDMPSIKITNFHDRCPPKTSKIAMAVDSRSADYHYWRQGPDGYYTHKPGSTDVIKVDASNRPIYRPDLANRNYTKKGSHLNYNRFCGYFCVPRTRRARVARKY